MVASGKRNIKPGTQYDKYFAAPQNQDNFLTYLGSNFDTLSHMRKIVVETLDQTAKIARVLKGKTLEDTARNVFDFVYNHYQYQQDSASAEELRSPYRAWKDRKTGVDCDCYTITISSILTNLGIDHAYKMTKYNGRSYYQHVYVVVPVNQKSYSKSDFNSRSKYLVIDPVVDQFNYEKKPSAAHHEIIKVSEMKHQLNGLSQEEEIASVLMGDVEGLGFFGKKARARRSARRAGRQERRDSRKQARQKRRDARQTARSIRRDARKETRSLPLFSKERREARKDARQSGRELKQTARQTGRALKKDTRQAARATKKAVRKNPTASNAAARVAAMRKAVANRQSSAATRAAQAQAKAKADAQFSDGYLRKLFTDQKRWADKNHKGILENQIKALIPYVKKSAQRRAGTSGKYLASRGWSVDRVMADARRVVPHLVPKKEPARPARKTVSRPSRRGSSTPQTATTRNTRPAASQFSDAWIRSFWALQERLMKDKKRNWKEQINAAISWYPRPDIRKKNAESEKQAKYIESRGKNYTRLLADAQKYGNAPKSQPASPQRPAPRPAPQPKPTAPPIPMAAAVPSKAASRPQPARLQKLNVEIAESRERTSKLAERLRELKQRNAALTAKHSHTRKMVVSNQHKLNEVLARKRKAEMKKACDCSSNGNGNITEIKTFAPKEARIKPLR
jgi:hypothetical protein